MNFERKYNLTVDENIFIAKRNIVDYIWKSAKLEGFNVTYPDVYSLYDGISVANLKIEEIVAVNNLKHSWYFVFDMIDYPTNFTFICQLNRIVGNTSWESDMPNKSLIVERLDKIQEIENPTERCITLMLYCLSLNMLLRTSMLAANHEMIRNGCGIISVPIEIQPEFTKLLVKFYETNDTSAVKQFVYDNCIDGIDMEAQRRYVEEQKKTSDNSLIKASSQERNV